jgi:short subunit dehydrogenase-like uncharacterized protein
MTGQAKWMIYGANGFTGRLAALEATRRGLQPVLAGRSAGPLERMAAELGCPARVFGLDDAAAAAAALADVAVVAHCAGPFSATSAPMVAACLASRTHYVDITGEIDVLVAAQGRHDDAARAGIVLCPGAGFDVIPTDCLAAVLSAALPDATHLTLAFDGGGQMSRGTARTMVESLRHGRRGGRVRRNGIILEVPLAHARRRIDFTGGSAMTAAIAWGDVATAYFSTGIPNIETYARMPAAAAILARATDWSRPLLACAPVQRLLRRLADRTPGPSEEALRTGRSRFWGEVRNAAGARRTARLEASNGYRLTADGVLMAVERLLEHAPSGGYCTPSRLMGARCVERLPGASAIRLDGEAD